MAKDGNHFRFRKRSRAVTGCRAAMCSGRTISSSSPARAKAADETGDHERGQHRRQNQEEQIVRGRESGNTHQRQRADEKIARTGNPVADV